MECKKCGSLLNGSERFCENCGEKVEKMIVQGDETQDLAKVQEVNENVEPVNDAKQTSNDAKQKVSPLKKLTRKDILIGAAVLIAVVIYLVSALVKTSSLVKNTTWIGRDGSEVVFTKDRIDWYKSPDDHDDNYYSGEYEMYIGENAVEYITEELSEYGVTKLELIELFLGNNDYEEDRFVVFDIRYDEYVLNGESKEIVKPLVPWYGFISEDGNTLNVVNMNTIGYYQFTKQ